jgi:hypothetical protein
MDAIGAGIQTGKRIGKGYHKTRTHLSSHSLFAFVLAVLRLSMKSLKVRQSKPMVMIAN